ncbi:MAG TPA: hypothetical protein VEB40_00720, partial [Flavipsychrobacter sp.]|nr:hypothetical protein [Flavipsychrobacter sp.]
REAINTFHLHKRKPPCKQGGFSFCVCIMLSMFGKGLVASDEPAVLPPSEFADKLQILSPPCSRLLAGQARGAFNTLNVSSL